MSILLQLQHRIPKVIEGYSGWFHSIDELINKIRYAGMYINQLCIIDLAHGDALVHLGSNPSTDSINLPQTDSLVEQLHHH